MTGKQMENKGWVVGGGRYMAAIANCVVGLLKCDGSNVKLPEGWLLAEAAISKCVLGLLISYDNDIDLRFGFIIAISNYVLGLLINYGGDMKPRFGFAY